LNPFTPLFLPSPKRKFHRIVFAALLWSQSEGKPGKVMHEYKEGSGNGVKVKSRKQELLPLN
jgi:hypothetical protein